jgi:hypothetical protein
MPELSTLVRPEREIPERPLSLVRPAELERNPSLERLFDTLPAEVVEPPRDE